MSQHTLHATLLAVLSLVAAYLIIDQASAQEMVDPLDTATVEFRQTEPGPCSYQDLIWDEAVSELRDELDLVREHVADYGDPGEEFVQYLERQINDWSNPAPEVLALHQYQRCPNGWWSKEIWRDRIAVRIWILEQSLAKARETYPEQRIYQDLIQSLEERLDQQRLDLARVAFLAVLEDDLVATYPTP